jgi:serine/threonine-protein kinase HipA
MRKAKIYYQNDYAGLLVETNDGEYEFTYDKMYVEIFPDRFLTFTMPVSTKPYRSNRLFPFFEGLTPEGWLLEIASRSWRINKNDRMGLLLACCRNCIGAVSVLPTEERDD